MAVQDNLLALLLTVVLLVDRSSSGEYELLQQLYTASTKSILHHSRQSIQSHFVCTNMQRVVKPVM